MRKKKKVRIEIEVRRDLVWCAPIKSLHFRKEIIIKKKKKQLTKTELSVNRNLLAMQSATTTISSLFL